MAVDSIQRVPALQVHQGADAREERDRLGRQKKEQKENKQRSPKLNPETGTEKTTEPTPEIGQILDSTKTLELLQVKASEPKTLRKHAFIELTQKENVKKTTLKPSNKLNKSA